MSSNQDALFRNWHLLRLIPRYPAKITARDLSERLESARFKVTKRTVERDLQALSAVFPLTADEREKPFGWSWQKDAPAFDLPGLSLDEALALKLTEQQLSALLPASVLDHLSPHFKAAARKLAGDAKARGAASWPDKIRVVHPTQTLLPPAITPEVQRAVFDALLNERQLRMRYFKRGESDPIDYTTHPLGIVQRGPVTYLVCMLFGYRDTRLLALHRIRSAEILEAPAERPQGFDLDQYIATGALGFGDGRTIKLEAIFSSDAAEHLHETPLSSDQVLRAIDEKRTRLVATVADTPQLQWWLLGFGDSVEVLRPKRLRAALAGVAAAMSRTYRKNH